MYIFLQSLLPFDLVQEPTTDLLELVALSVEYLLLLFEQALLSDVLYNYLLKIVLKTSNINFESPSDKRGLT